MSYVNDSFGGVSVPMNSAIAAAASQVGIPNYNPANVTATTVTLGSETTPFLSDGLAGNTTWQIEFTSLQLDLASGNPALANPNITDLVVILVPNSTQVLKVSSVWPAGSPPIAAYPATAEEQRQLKAAGIFYDLPSQPATAALMSAIANTSAWSSSVRQIIAYYVMETSSEYTATAVWIIQQRGFPSFPPIGGRGTVTISPDATNHLRTVADATTGAELGGDTIPQPPTQQ